MRAVIQRVSRGSVTIDRGETRSIGQGLVVLIGIHPNDTLREIDWMSDKIVHLRIFEDDEGKMNRSVQDIGGQVLIVSQFTLYGDCRKGRRPGYSAAAPPSVAKPLYEQFVDRMNTLSDGVESGSFQAYMEVELVNDGPVTLLLDSDKTF